MRANRVTTVIFDLPGKSLQHLLIFKRSICDFYFFSFPNIFIVRGTLCLPSICFPKKCENFNGQNTRFFFKSKYFRISKSEAANEKFLRKVLI